MAVLSFFAITTLLFGAFIISLGVRHRKYKISTKKKLLSFLFFVISALLLYYPASAFSLWLFSPQETLLESSVLQEIELKNSSREYLEISYSPQGHLYGVFWNPKANTFYSERLPSNSLSASELGKAVELNSGEVYFTDASPHIVLPLVSSSKSKNALKARSAWSTKTTASPRFAQTLQRGIVLTNKGAFKSVFPPPLSTNSANHAMIEELFSFTPVASPQEEGSAGVYYVASFDGVFAHIFYTSLNGKTVNISNRLPTGQYYAPYYWNGGNTLVFQAMVRETLTKIDQPSPDKDSLAQADSPAETTMYVMKLLLLRNPLQTDKVTLLEKKIAATKKLQLEKVKTQGTYDGRYLAINGVRQENFLLFNRFDNQHQDKSGADSEFEFPLRWQELDSISSFAINNAVETAKNGIAKNYTLALLAQKNGETKQKVFTTTLKEKRTRLLSLPATQWLFLILFFLMFLPSYGLSLKLH